MAKVVGCNERGMESDTVHPALCLIYVPLTYQRINNPDVHIQFHIHRSKAIFDWIFHTTTPDGSTANYELYYLSCNNIGLADDAVEARRVHEARGESNVKTKLAPKYPTLEGVWTFLTTHHDFYSASKLAKRGAGGGNDVGKDSLLKLSYGKSDSSRLKQSVIQFREGRVLISLDIVAATALLFLVVGIFVAVTKSSRGSHPSLKAN